MGIIIGTQLRRIQAAASPKPALSAARARLLARACGLACLLAGLLAGWLAG